MSEKNMIKDYTEGPLLRQLIAFALPLILANMLQSAYSLVDMIVVGNFAGSLGLSAVGIGGQLQGLITGVGMGLGLGGQIIIAQQVGEKNIEGIRKTIGTFFSVTAISAVLIGVIGLLSASPFIRVMNTPEEVRGEAIAYVVICCFGMLFIFGYNAVGAVLRGMGESRLPTLFVAIAAVSNMVLDLVFVAGFHMGAAGAALATVIAQGLSFIFSIIYLYWHKESFGFDFRPASFRIDRRLAGVIIRLSVPLVVWGILLSLSLMFINANVNVYGVAASAVDSVGNKLTMIVSAVTMGVYTAGAGIVGQCFGAGKFDRIRKLFYLVGIISVVIWVVIAAVIILFSCPIFRIFTADADVLAIAPRYMKICAVSFLAMSLSMPSFSIFDGIGNTRLEMIVGILDNLLARISLSFLFAHFFGMYGYWMGAAVGGFVTPLVGTVYFYSGIWKKRNTVA